MARKRFTEREVIETLILQGVEITCFRCTNPVESASDLEREHLTELGLGGEDTPTNCAYSHADCHSIVTNGTKATSAGSSKHRIAKVKRLRGERKPRPKKRWAAGRKIPPRPFPKRARK